MNRGNKEAVISLLQENSEGLTIVETSRLLGISRQVISGVLNELACSGSIRVRQVGMAKLNFLEVLNEN